MSKQDSERHGDLGFALPAPARPHGTRVVALLVLGCATLAGAFAVGYLPRKQQQSALARDTHTDASSLPVVDVIKPKSTSSARPVSLPANLQPLAETVLYSRANGYVERFDVDIGESVKQGQLLAQIETPEIDQQIDQARAQLLQSEAALGQTQAQRDYANTSLERYKRLQPAGVATRQELDEKTAQARVTESNVNAAAASIEVHRADLRRLTQIKSFARVTAPFAGTITQRQIERGALVSSSTALFKLVASDPIRAFLQVPQDLAVGVKPGLAVQLHVREYPGRNFEASLTRTAGVLDPATRTMTAEIRVPNPQHELMPGMYAEASLALSSTHTVFELPVTALYNDAAGLRVAVVDAQNTLHFQTIVIERDAGATLLIASGLRAEDRVVKLANAALHEGDHVQVR